MDSIWSVMSKETVRVKSIEIGPRLDLGRRKLVVIAEFSNPQKICMYNIHQLPIYRNSMKGRYMHIEHALNEIFCKLRDFKQRVQRNSKGHFSGSNLFK